MRKFLLSAASFALAAITSTMVSGAMAADAAVAGNVTNGETVFKTRCALCHTVTPDGMNSFTGPNVFKIFGRKAGTHPGFPFSDGLKNSGIVWDEAKMKEYLAAPNTVIQGGKMAFVGPTDPTEMQDVVAYMASLK